jgi:threonine aldolase
MTRPTEEMLRAAGEAQVGDDCYGEDPTVVALQKFAADMFGKEAALFMPSGTMSNQVAVAALTHRGDELICDSSYHINFFEAAQTSALNQISINPVTTLDGILRVPDVQRQIDARARWTRTYAVPVLVTVENTVNGHCGKPYPLEELKRLRQFTRAKGMSLYMDGARLLNACAATGISPKEYARQADALAVCLGKGLSCPFGSVLIGSHEFIQAAKRLRKWFGGGLHQSGYIAAMGLEALRNYLPILEEDHERARRLADSLDEVEGITVRYEGTNMVMWDVGGLSVDADGFVDEAKKRGVLLLAWTPRTVRAVTYRGVSNAQIERAGLVVSDIARRLGIRKTTARQASMEAGVS